MDRSVKTYRKNPEQNRVEIGHEIVDGSVETKDYFGEICFVLKQGKISTGERRGGIWHREGVDVYFTCPWCRKISAVPKESLDYLRYGQVMNLRDERFETLSVWCSECGRHLFIRLSES